MRKTLAKLLFLAGIGACALPLLDRASAWLIDHEYEQLRTAQGPITYRVFGKRRDRAGDFVEVRRVSGVHGLPAWAVRVGPGRWAEVQAGDEWEGAAPAGEASPLFRSADTGLGGTPLFPRLALGGMALAASAALRSRMWRRES